MEPLPTALIRQLLGAKRVWCLFTESWQRCHTNGSPQTPEEQGGDAPISKDS